MQLSKGQKVDITKGKNMSSLSLYFGWSKVAAELSIDASCFILSEQSRCERDDDFIFYGNPFGLNGVVAHNLISSTDKEAIKINLSKLPPQAAKFAFTVTIHEPEKHGFTMKDITNMYLRLVNDDNGEELYRYEYGSDLSNETAIVAGELYKHNGEWKFNAIGSGFFGGLAALCTSFGLEIEGEAESVSNAEAKKEVAAAVEVKPVSSIDLRKKLVQITLEKKNMTHISARVGLVLDISGSMGSLYKNGTVQEVVERILAVACKFDDDASLDVWIYDNKFSRMPAATENNFEQYVQKQIMENKNINKFGWNNEPPVMEDVIRKYTVEDVSDIPVFIIFINDGGVVKAIKKVIKNAASKPIFWQFVGIGHSDFEVLQQLDTMEGRIVDNANFIHIENIATISDETLYNQLLNEFPEWLKAAKVKGIVTT